jgi:hypothetical protein
MSRLVSLVGLTNSQTSWRSPGGAPLTVALLTVLLLVGARPVYGYTYARVALGSNILVDGERIIFAQGTGSLTVLDLKTGNVLLRKKPASHSPYSGRLQKTNHGVLMMGYDRIALLDGRTFDIVWQVGECYAAATDGEYVVSHDGNHTVTGRNVQSGKVCWTTQMDGGWHLMAVNGKALVNAPDYAQSALLILDLETGRKLLRHQAPAGFHWLGVYFDGLQICVVDDGGIKDQWNQGKPRNLLTVDLQGNIAAQANYNSPEVVPGNKWRWNGTFLWGDKYFPHDGQVRTVNAHERKAIVEFWKEANDLPYDLQRPANHWSERQFVPEVLASGVFMNVPTPDALGEAGQLLQTILPKGAWKAYAPHLGQHGEVYQIAEAPGRILLGTSEGQVECLDVETGRPRWLYCFPTIRETMTYSSPHGMPPRLAQQQAIYRDTVDKMKVPCGSIVLPQEFDPRSAKWTDLQNSATYEGKITADPSVDDPFPDSRGILAFLTLVPATILIFVLVRFARRRVSDPKNDQPARGNGAVHLVIWCMVLSVFPAYGLLAYGGISYPWTVALKFVFVASIIGASCGISRLFVSKRWIESVVLTAVLIGWFYLMLGLLMDA